MHSDQEGQGFFDVGEIDYQRQKAAAEKAFVMERGLGQTGFFSAAV